MRKLKPQNYWMIQGKEKRNEEKGHHYPDIPVVNATPYPKPLEGIYGPLSRMTHPTKTYQPPEIELSSTRLYMTDVQLNYINDGNNHFQLHKPSHSTKQKLISAKTLYIATLLDSDLSGVQIYDQTGFSSATVSHVYSQHYSNPPKDSGDDPLKLTMTNINYIGYIICMGKVNNTTKAIKTLQDIINTIISCHSVCYLHNVRGIRLVIKRKGHYSNLTIGGQGGNLLRGI
jgi:hypothetical protein